VSRMGSVTIGLLFVVISSIAAILGLFALRSAYPGHAS
jgi:hypothetical protein